jgi:hypothetical protein
MKPTELTEAQREAIERLKERFPNLGEPQATIGMDQAVVCKASDNLWIVIETDGYIHS